MVQWSNLQLYRYPSQATKMSCQSQTRPVECKPIPAPDKRKNQPPKTKSHQKTAKRKRKEIYQPSRKAIMILMIVASAQVKGLTRIKILAVKPTLTAKAR